MSTHEDHSHHAPGQSLEESREKVLARGKPFPRYEDMVIEDLTDDEEERFLAAVADA